MRWKALAEIYTMHSFAPFWNPKNEENHGEKRTWSNPGKNGQEKLISSRSFAPVSNLKFFVKISANVGQNLAKFC